MTASNFNIRCIAPDVMLLLKRAAKEQKTSMNLLILKFVEQGLGYSGKVKRTLHHDLDTLAGTWSAKDSKTFENNIDAFEKIDEDLWL